MTDVIHYPGPFLKHCILETGSTSVFMH